MAWWLEVGSQAQGWTGEFSEPMLQKTEGAEAPAHQ